MSRGDKKEGFVVDQKDALSVYFDALLREESSEAVTVVETELEKNPAPVLTPPVIGVPAIPDIEIPSEVETDTTTVAEAELSVQTQPVAGAPEWAEEPFQALLFKVAGLTLAVPLSELSGVQEWADGMVTPMLGRIEWYLGLAEYRGQQVPVVDTAQLVLPEDRLDRLVTDDMNRMGHVVFIQDGQWGLACDEVNDVISLNHDEVKWRTSRSKRRWLAGTVLEHMCAIIDPPVFADMLRTGIADLPEEDEV